MTYSYDHPHPAVTADVVVLRRDGHETSVLLIRRRDEPYAGAWALPGGFLNIDESLEACARRELFEETGLQPARLEQLHCFGAPGRDPRERVITVAYVTVFEESDGSVSAGSDAAAAAWFPYSDLPELAFDHRDIIDTAHRRLMRPE